MSDQDFMSQKQMVSWNEYVRHLAFNLLHHSQTPKGKLEEAETGGDYKSAMTGIIPLPFDCHVTLEQAIE